MTEPVELGEVARVVDCEHRTAPKAEPGAEYGFSIGTRDIKGGRIDYAAAKRVDIETFDGWTRRAVPGAGDLILAREAPVGEVGYIDGLRPVCLGQRTVMIRLDQSRAYPRFVHYQLLAHAAQEWMAAHCEGSTVVHLNVSDVRRIPVDLPPLAEQRRIAEVLGELDDLVDVNEQLVTRAASLAREVFRSRFRSFAEPNAAEVPFTDYVDVISGGTPKTSEGSYWGGDIPWFSIVDAPGDIQPWVLRTVKTITRQGLESSPTNLIPVGSTILSARGTVGKVALVGVPMTMNQSCYALKPRGEATGFFEFFATESVVNRLKAAAHGSVFDTITRQTLESMLVEVVPHEYRAAFNERVEALMNTCRDLALENEQLRRTRDELLPLLMSGAVRVRPEGVAA